jgi:hypothetical protein
MEVEAVSIHHQQYEARLPDSNTNGNSTDTFTSDPPVWANSRTSMEMPKIECPIKRVDESREKLLSWLLNPLFKARKKGNNQPHPVQSSATHYSSIKARITVAEESGRRC